MQVIHPAALPVAQFAIWPIMEEGQPHDGEQGLAIADQVAEYSGPIHSTVGKMLWAIQAWYGNVGDEETAEAILTAEPRVDVTPR